LSDTYYKSNKELVHMLVKAASLGSNLLLNIGPMPSGKIQPEFQDRLAGLGDWLKVYGESIYGTKAGFIKPQAWGSITQSDKKVYIHIVDGKTSTLNLENVPLKKIKKAYLLKDNSAVNFTFKKSTLNITATVNATEPDQVIVLEIG
jgi:alpha-L-fucosidase